MPTYDYECSKCGHRFDAFQSMSDEPLTVCPACKKHALRRLIGGGMGVIFKGSGFYATDSRASSKKKKSESVSASSGSTDGGSAGATSSSSGSDGTASTKTSTPAAASTGSDS